MQKQINYYYIAVCLFRGKCMKLISEIDSKLFWTKVELMILGGGTVQISMEKVKGELKCLNVWKPC